MTHKLELLIENYSCAYPHEKAPHDMLSFYRTEREVFSKKNKKSACKDIENFLIN